MQPLKISALVFILAINISSQDTDWYWQNPLPQGNTLEHLQITSSNSGYTIGSAGTIIKTVSAGEEWNVVDFPSKTNLKALSFISETVGWVIGQKDNVVELFSTLNGGIHWEVIFTNTGELVSVCFLNNNIGWMSIDSLIYFTTDSGNNWQINNLHKEIIKIHFNTMDLGWALSNDGIFRTTNGGNSWSYNYLGIYTPSIRMKDIQMVTNQLGWAVGNDLFQFTAGAYLFRTTDGGEIWDLQLHEESILIKDLEFKDEDLGWFITYNNNELFRTTNGGIDWNEIGDLLEETNEIKYVNDSVLWAVGRGGHIITSTDSGTNWINHTIGTRRQLNAICFLNDNYGYITGYNILLKTTNAGKHWEEKEIPFDGDPGSIWFVDSLTGFACCRYNLLKTTDGGDTWIIILTLSSDNFKEICFINRNIGWIGTIGGKIYKTIDGGINWNVISDLEISIYTMDFINESLGWCGGYIGLQKTTNGGFSWINISLPVYIVPTDIFFINNQIGWVIGYGEGAILKTIDGGQTWEIQHNFPTFGAALPRSLSFSDSLNGLATTGKIELGNVLQTTNGGDTWNAVDLPTSNVMRNLWFINKERGWILGNLGNIFCNDNSIIVSTNNLKFNSIPNKLILSQNYPNPFNPSTKISWQSPVGSWQTLKVYDVLGREVVTLIDEYRETGYHEVEFNPESSIKHPASGVYFYLLRAGDYVETKKMIYLK